MTQRNLSLDILKVILSFFVVALHCKILIDVNTDAYFATVHGLFRLAVPIFLIINGYYFFKISSKDSLKKWLLRIGTLYIIWMIFYSPFWFRLSNPLSTMFTIINGYYVLWYLSGTLISGLVVYFLRNKKSMTLALMLVTFYFIGFTIQTMGNWHFLPEKIDELFNLNFIHRNAFLMCMPFFLMGFLIRRHDIDKRLNIGVPVLILAVMAVMLEAILQSRYISDTEGIDQLLTLLIASPIVFLYFKNIVINGQSKELANFSVAIYLIHPFFVLMLKHYDVAINSLLFTLIVATLSSVSALVLLMINKKFSYIL